MTAATLPTTSREVKDRLADLERELHELPAVIERAIDAEDSATALRLERRRMPELQAQIADLSAQFRALEAQELAARLAAFAERQRREYAESQQAVASTFANLRSALYDAAIAAGLQRRNVAELARREAALHLDDPVRERVVLSRDSGAAYVLKFAEALSQHLDGLPTLDRELLDRITDSEMGDALRVAHDGFHQR